MALSVPSRPTLIRLTGSMLACTLAGYALAGCSSDEKKKDPDSPPSTNAPESPKASDDKDDAAKDDVLAAYNNMREIQIKMNSDGDLHTLDLAKYTKGQPSVDLKKAVLRNKEMGIKFTGRPTMNPKVTSVNTGHKTATVDDCFDARKWKPVYRDSGKAVELAKQRLKYPVTSRATLEDGKWLITKVTPDRTKGC